MWRTVTLKLLDLDTDMDTELAEVAAWAQGIEAVHARIAGRFSRPEPRRRVLAYLKGLLSSIERKNCWQLAEQAGDLSPDGVQRLLATDDWDADLVRDDLQCYVVEHLGHPQGVLIIDETGFIKKGTKSVVVKRQYSGTAGRIENCQIGVFLAYASQKGRAFLDRELYLPKEWAQDRVRRQEAGVPEEVVFQTKPQLSQVMLQRALDGGVPAAWVTGDEVYGSDRSLRVWLEQREVAHVLAIKSNEPLWVGTDQGPAQVRAAKLAAQVPEVEWVRLSAGDGAGIRLDPSGHPSLESSWERLLAVGAPEYRQARGTGLLRMFRRVRNHLRGIGRSSWNPVGH